jgi:uncharacterized membrane protein
MIRAFFPRLWTTRAVLIASLSINIFMIAFLATQFLGGRGPMLATAAPPALIAHVAQRLPAADAEALWQAYRAREPEVAAAQTEYRKALLAAAALLQVQRIDEPRFRQAVMEARDKRVTVGDRVIDVFLDALPRMSPEGRQGLLSKGLR